MIKEKFGARIRSLRLESHLSQEQLALKINMDRSYLASVEKGKRNISIINIEKIANGLDVTLEKIFKEL